MADLHVGEGCSGLAPRECNKETQNPFSDSFGFKNRNLGFS